jgi:hypothetical protein
MRDSRLRLANFWHIGQTCTAEAHRITKSNKLKEDCYEVAICRNRDCYRHGHRAGGLWFDVANSFQQYTDESRGDFSTGGSVADTTTIANANTNASAACTISKSYADAQPIAYTQPNSNSDSSG